MSPHQDLWELRLQRGRESPSVTLRTLPVSGRAGTPLSWPLTAPMVRPLCTPPACGLPPQQRIVSCVGSGRDAAGFVFLTAYTSEMTVTGTVVSSTAIPVQCWLRDKSHHPGRSASMANTLHLTSGQHCILRDRVTSLQWGGSLCGCSSQGQFAGALPYCLFSVVAKPMTQT